MHSYDQRQRNRADELVLVDSPDGVLLWEKAFCREFALTGHFLEAMRNVCTMDELLNCSDQSLRMKAVALLKRPVIIQYIKSLDKRLEDMGVMSMLEVQMFLTDAKRTAIGDIDEHDPLCHKKTTTTTYHRDGSETEKITLEMVNKLEAIKIFKSMKGWDAPIRVDHNHAVGIMVVPVANSIDDWKAAVGNSQQKLMEDAIDI